MIVSDDVRDLYRVFHERRLLTQITTSQFSGPLTCALERLPEQRRQARFRTEDRIRETILDAAEVFGPIPVNPSNTWRSRKIKRTFCYAKQESFVNSSETSINVFVDKIVSFSRAMRASESENAATRKATSPSEAHLIGAKGTGKTHFLNYVLTRHIERLDQSRVIWIRLSLSRDFGVEQTPISLLEWFKAELARIAIRYYDTNSKYKRPNAPSYDFASHLRSFVQSRPIESHDKQKLRLQLDRMIERFLDKAKEVPIDSDWVNPYLADEIFAFFVRNDWTFLAVIDQMDLLSHSVTLKEKFLNRGRQLNHFRMSAKDLPIFTLLSRRPETTPFLSETEEQYREQATSFSNINFHPFEQYELGQIDFRNFISKRLDFARNPDNYESPTKLLVDAAFRDHSEILLSDRIFSLAGCNLRSYIQLVTVVISNKNAVHDYEFTERAMLLNYVFPRIPFSYQQIEGTKTLVRRFNQAAVTFDIMYLPSIFRAPYAANGSETPDAEDLLRSYVLGIRILLLLKCLSGTALSCIQIADLMRRCFRSDPAVVRLMLEEFIDFELIQAATIYPGAISILEGVKLTSRGVGITELYVQDPTYLAFCLQSLPLPYSLATSISVRSPREAYEPSVDWVVCKVDSALTLASLVRQALNHKLTLSQIDPSAVSGASIAGVKIETLVGLFNNECGQLCRKIEHEVIKTCASVIAGLTPGERVKVREALFGTLAN